jgi:hypothetical protein
VRFNAADPRAPATDCVVTLRDVELDRAFLICAAFPELEKQKIKTTASAAQIRRRRRRRIARSTVSDGIASLVMPFVSLRRQAFTYGKEK